MSNPAPLSPIPSRPFALAAAAAVVASVGLGVLAAVSAGGAGTVLVVVGMFGLLAGAMMFVPLVGPPLVTPERWGLVVMGMSAGRTLVALAALLLCIEILGLPRRPVVFGVLAATVTVMMIETCTAVWLLNRRERLRAATVKSEGGRPDARPSTAHSIDAVPAMGSTRNAR